MTLGSSNAWPSGMSHSSSPTRALALYARIALPPGEPRAATNRPEPRSSTITGDIDERGRLPPATALAIGLPASSKARNEKSVSWLLRKNPPLRAGTEQRLHRRRHRDDVALVVDDDEMTRAGDVARRVASRLRHRRRPEVIRRSAGSGLARSTDQAHALGEVARVEQARRPAPRRNPGRRHTGRDPRTSPGWPRQRGTRLAHPSARARRCRCARAGRATAAGTPRWTAVAARTRRTRGTGGKAVPPRAAGSRRGPAPSTSRAVALRGCAPRCVRQAAAPAARAGPVRRSCARSRRRPGCARCRPPGCACRRAGEERRRIAATGPAGTCCWRSAPGAAAPGSRLPPRESCRRRARTTAGVRIWRAQGRASPRPRALRWHGRW